MLSEVDQNRRLLAAKTDSKRKSHLGQFLTPASIATFMASLFEKTPESACRLLDPGAGIGSLSAAFLDRWLSGGLNFNSIVVTAYELDESLLKELERTFALYDGKASLSTRVIGGDFIEEAVNWLQFKSGAYFTHAILNPPYKKINSDSRHRFLLRQVGIETVNLYSAFVALALALMAPGGQVVAIIPRSFCNGPYYRPFRKFILERAAIRRLHLFGSRSKAFKQDDVLQENVIILLERGRMRDDVTVSTSMDDTFSDLVTYTHPYNRIVFPDDVESYIHVPASPDYNIIEMSPSIRYSLDDIGLSVSTGPVVDFRLKEYIRDMPEPGTVPLLYPGHFVGQTIDWPKPGMKKPNAIHFNANTKKWLYPTGFYCVVRRFSSKEEKRRILASIVEPEIFGDVQMLGFENHLNVFHDHKQGIPRALARGLAMFLNTTAVDKNFRRFSGHTQVNAADLKLMKYPSREALIALGEWAMQRGGVTQALIDEQLERLIA